MRVNYTMTRKVITVRPEDSLADAAAQLSITRLHALPVVDVAHKLLGLLLERDVLAAVTRAHPEPSDVPLYQLARFVLPDAKVRDLMKPPTAVVRPNIALKEAARQMLEHEVYGLPIVNDEGGLLGVFTVTDMLRAVTQGDLVLLWP